MYVCVCKRVRDSDVWHGAVGRSKGEISIWDEVWVVVDVGWEEGVGGFCWI